MSVKVFLILGLSILLVQCKNKEQDKVYAPSQANEFVWVYKPAEDHFFGPDTEYLKEGEWYDEWVANDHTFVKDKDGQWYISSVEWPNRGVSVDKLSWVEE